MIRLLSLVAVLAIAIATVHGTQTSGSIRRQGRLQGVLPVMFASARESQKYEDCSIKSAVVLLQPDNGSGVRGVIYLTQEENSTSVKVFGTITGLTPGNHGFHIHKSGKLVEGCKAALGHFNPHMQRHGAPEDEERHVGDLGNIHADSKGTAAFRFLDGKISLCGPIGIMGRSIVVHEKTDDLGRGDGEGSITTGNAGGRVACGVIEEHNLHSIANPSQRIHYPLD